MFLYVDGCLSGKLAMSALSRTQFIDLLFLKNNGVHKHEQYYLLKRMTITCEEWAHPSFQLECRPLLSSNTYPRPPAPAPHTPKSAGGGGYVWATECRLSNTP